MYASFLEALDDKPLISASNICTQQLKELVRSKFISNVDGACIYSITVNGRAAYNLFIKALGDSDEAKTLLRIINIYLNVYEDGLIIDKIVGMLVKELNLNSFRPLDHLHEKILNNECFSSRCIKDWEHGLEAIPDGKYLPAWIEKYKLKDFISEQTSPNFRILMKFCPIRIENIVWNIMNSRDIKSLLIPLRCNERTTCFYSPFKSFYIAYVDNDKLEEIDYNMEQCLTKEEIKALIKKYIRDFNGYGNE